MSSQAVMKRQILALAKREPSNEELQKIKQSLSVYKNLTKEEQSKINEMVKNAHAKLESEGKFAKGGTTKTQSLKTALTDLKNKVGVKKFKRATSGTDIKKDIAIPALKGGKRIVRTKGKTSNQYGTFKNQVGTTYYENRANRSDVNQPSEKRKIKLAKGGEMEKKSAKFKVGDKVYSYQNKSESAPIAYVKFSAWDSENGAHPNDVWKYKLSLKDGYSNWINEESLSETPKEKFAQGGEVHTMSAKDRARLDELQLKENDNRLTKAENIEYDKLVKEYRTTKEYKHYGKYAKGGEVSQYIDGLSKQEVLSKTIVYDNGGESYDRYTIFTPDGSVYGMSETAEGFNQYIGDSSEIEKGKHLGKKLRSVPKGIQGAVLHRMLDDEQMFAKGGKIAKYSKIDLVVKKPYGDEQMEVAKFKGKGDALISASALNQNSPINYSYSVKDSNKYAKGGNVRDWSVSNVTDAKYLGVIEFQDNQEEYHNFEIMETDDRLVFGSFTNSGFIESGYIEKDGMSTDETLQNLLEDLEVYYNDGGQYTSMIVFNQRMANGGKLRSKAKYIPNRNIDEIEVTRNGKTTSIDGANLLDGVYVKKGTKFAKGGMMNANEHFRLRGFEFLKDDLATLQQAIQENNQEEIQKFFSYWGQHLEMLKTTNNERMFSFLKDDLSQLKIAIDENNQEEIDKFFSYWEYHLQSLKYAQGGTIKKSLAEFKNKVGASKYREATRGVDIKADLQIPALKKGRRVVTSKGKTSNQYGTFKNKVGRVYYENRPNHYDVNQPSEKRKIKLADGGSIGNKVYNEMYGVGKSKYIVNFHNGEKTHKDGSPFFDIAIFKNKIEKDNFVKDLKSKGFVYKYAQGGTFADGGVLEGAKIYVADLAEYNNGRLVGKWFDLSDYSDASELMGAIQEMLDEQTAKDKYGEVHEEWAVHDFEGFPRSFYSEYMGEKDFEKLYQIAEVANDRGLPIDVLMEAVADFGADEDQIERIAEAYYTSIPASMGNESRDFAYEYIDSNSSITDAVSNPDFYFDYESFGSDARMDYTDEELEEYGYDELDDTELGERLVDEMGGIEQLGNKTIEMYFDYDKFGRDLEYDFTAVKGDDGNVYYFSSNW